MKKREFTKSRIAKIFLSLAVVVLSITSIFMWSAICSFEDNVLASFRPNDYGFSPKMQKISSFSTDFSSSKEDRKHNIRLASENFSWLVIKKGDTLSFNTIVGKRTEERGYKMSKVIVDGEYTQGVGGGVCQVSTTLYNAWIRGGLGTKYVRAHSLPASYCGLSQDATVSDYIDLILLNDSEYDVIVNGYIKDNKVYFDIYGNPLEYTIDIRSELIEKLIPPEPIIEEVEEYPSDFKGEIKTDAYGEYGIVKSEKTGYKSKAFMDYYDKEGNLIKSKELRKDNYLPTQGKIYRKIPKSMTLPYFPDVA